MLCFHYHNSTNALPSHSHKRNETKLASCPKMMMMIGGTITSSSSSAKITLEDVPAGIFRRRGAEIFPSVPRKTFFLKFSRLDSVRSRILKPIPVRSSSIKVSQVNIEEGAENEPVEQSPRKTVRVRFQLRKECVFGEHFFILGGDPVFGGLWEPENALPLNWSDGHVWTVDLDLPVERLVEFKFILKAKTGEILWQPGPNRALQTWETNKSIRICEDWDNADLQMMMEEDFVPVCHEDKQPSVNLDYMPIADENVAHPKQSVRLQPNVSSSGATEEVEVLETVQQNPSVVAIENAGYGSDDPEENSSLDIHSEDSNGALTARDENVTKEAMFTEEEVPVLVPGLIPLPGLENEEVSGPITHVSVEVINEGKAETFPELDRKQETEGDRNEKGKVKAVSLFEKPEQEAVEGVEKRHYNAGEEEMQQQRLETEPLGTPNALLEKDILWGRRKLYKLLSNFGLF